MSDLVVEVKGLTRRFGKTLALDGIDFSASSGKVYGLVGANGAGKTTLMKHLLGLLRAHSGSVRMFGLDPVKHPVEVLKRVGYLSEERDLPDWMSIEELMRYSQGYYANWDVSYENELLDTFSLDRSKKIKQLSRGMRAQVALIAAVAHKPDLLLLDEPSSGLDAVVRKDILNAVVRTISDEGRTVIFSSHLLDEVERLSDHVVMIDQGRVVFDGEMEAVAATHHYTTVRFDNNLTSKPAITGALTLEGSGRSWSLIHTHAHDELQAIVLTLGGEIIESRNASLEEIFVARVGRDTRKEEAA